MHKVAVCAVDLDVVESDLLASLYGSKIRLFQVLEVFEARFDRVGVVAVLERDSGRGLDCPYVSATVRNILAMW